MQLAHSPGMLSGVRLPSLKTVHVDSVSKHFTAETQVAAHFEMPDLESLRQSINDAVRTAKTEDERLALKSIIQDAMRSVESPHEVVWRMYVEPHSYAVLRTATAFRIFHHLADEALSAETLANKCNAQKLLVVRLCRVLAAMGILKEVDVEQYENGPIGNALARDPFLEGGVNFM